MRFFLQIYFSGFRIIHALAPFGSNETPVCPNYGGRNRQARLNGERFADRSNRLIITRPVNADVGCLRRHGIELHWSRMELGRISAIFRYPVKSMAGELLDAATLSWHGIEGDRRFAFRRLADKSGFPWLTASKLPQLLLYKPFGRDDNTSELLPTHVCTPDGKEYELRSDELREEISSRSGSEVEPINLRHGIFDEACISVITLGTVHGVERESGRDLDLRRFRPNIVLETDCAEPFEEDSWVGRTLMFGEGNTGTALRVTMRDERCVMVNFDPDTAERDSQVMKTIVRINENCAGVYGTVVSAGELRVGQVVTVGG
jgi:uncharacterized protein YcbX